MCRLLRTPFALLLLLLSMSLAGAEPAEKRIALVIGNADYKTGALKTAANDAGLVAQTLQAAGFDVIGARDLDQEALRRAFRDFLDKATSSGPQTVAFVYLSGYGVQLEGENYLLPVDAKIGRAADIAAEGVRLSDYLRPLGALKLKASIFVVDAARKIPFAISEEPLAGGLALVEPAPGTLVAFNAAPGTIAPEQNGAYGAYAQALAEMIRAGNLSPREVFERVRLRVSDMTKGAQLPWDASRLETAVVFFEHSPDAPPSAAAGDQARRPIAELGASEAYSAALERDTLEAYQEFLGAYPDDPMAKRVRAIIAARREAITWRETYAADTPQAYWSYLRRYPRGPHSADARRRLALRAFAADPPAGFADIDYNVPPPEPQEQTYVEQGAIAFDDPQLGFVPPPPVPVYLLPPPPAEFVVLPEPPPPIEVYALPFPVFVPIPVWCHRPAYVAPPSANVIYENIHNSVVVNHVTRTVNIRDRHDRLTALPAQHAMALAPSLPPSLARRAGFNEPRRREMQGTGWGSASAQRGSSPSLGRPLPGMHGQALPPLPSIGMRSPGRAQNAAQPAPAAAPAGNRALPPQSAFAHGGPISTAREPIGAGLHALPGANGRPLPPLPGMQRNSSNGPAVGRSAIVSSPPAGALQGEGRSHFLPRSPAILAPPTGPANGVTRPPLAAAPSRPALPSSVPSIAPRIAPPSAAPPAPVRPPVQAMRPPAPSPAPSIRLPSPPVQAVRPPSPPVQMFRPPAAAAIRPAPAPAPVFRPPPAPVARPAPPAIHAAPAPRPAAPPAANRPAGPHRRS